MKRWLLLLKREGKGKGNGKGKMLGGWVEGEGRGGLRRLYGEEMGDGTEYGVVWRVLGVYVHTSTWT